MNQALALLRPMGIDVFCTGKKFLVYNMVGRNLKVKYRRSIFGILWTLLSPLSLVAVYYFVFKVVLKIQTPNYLAYLVSGILVWSFFAQTVLEGMESLLGNSGLISKIPIPIHVFPYVGTVTNFITLMIATPIMIGTSLFSGVDLGLSLILLPFILLCVAMICYAVAIVLSILLVFFMDLRHVTSIILQIWFYGTPVLYHPEMIPEKLKWIIFANPVGSAIVSVHQILSEGIWPPLSYILATVGWSVVSMAIALIVLKSFRDQVAENI